MSLYWKEKLIKWFVHLCIYIMCLSYNSHYAMGICQLSLGLYYQYKIEIN